MLLKKNIPFSYVFGKIKYEIIAITIYAILVTILYNTYHLRHISIPISIPAILGTVISLLLGFRSNQAYDRWWEARHVWGAIVNDSRSVSRQITSFMPTDDESGQVNTFTKRFIFRQIAWCYSLGRHLRGQNASKGLDNYLDGNEYELIVRMDNIPAALLDRMGKDLQLALEEGWINRFQQIELDRTLSRLTDAMGKCERIKNTVFPSTYSLYIHLSLMLFIALLPFGVIEYIGLFEVPLVVAVSACFLLIEKMGIHLQDPFENKPTDTPMTTIAKSIEKNLIQIYQLQLTPVNRFSLVRVKDGQVDGLTLPVNGAEAANANSLMTEEDACDKRYQQRKEAAYYVL